jgi:Molybdopterin-binding domain of aldehyde dehydrogenase
MLAKIMGMRESDILIHVQRAGGAFGRRYASDCMAQAAMISKMQGEPVKLLWTRAQDIQHDMYRPGGFHYFKAGLDADDKLVAFRDHLITFGEGDRINESAGMDGPEFPGATRRGALAENRQPAERCGRARPTPSHARSDQCDLCSHRQASAQIAHRPGAAQGCLKWIWSRDARP